jgi:hypothetical protein
MLESYSDSLVARIQHVEHLERTDVGRTPAPTVHRYVTAVEVVRILILGLDASGSVCMMKGRRSA